MSSFKSYFRQYCGLTYSFNWFNNKKKSIYCLVKENIWFLSIFCKMDDVFMNDFDFDCLKNILEIWRRWCSSWSRSNVFHVPNERLATNFIRGRRVRISWKVWLECVWCSVRGWIVWEHPQKDLLSDSCWREADRVTREVVKQVLNLLLRLGWKGCKGFKEGGCRG